MAQSDSSSPPVVHLEEAEEGEPWLVSYADMMTLLFGFFVLMYSFAVAKVDETNSDEWVRVKREVAAYFGGSGSESAPAPVKSEAASAAQQKQSSAAGPADATVTGSGRDSSSDVPAVPFDSKFRFLATRDEISDEVASLLASLAERSSNEGSTVEKLRGKVEVEVLRGMLARVGTGSGGKDVGFEGPSKNEDGADEKKDVGSGNKPVTVVTDRRRLLSGDDQHRMLTPEGQVFLQQLARQLVAFRRPLDVTVEAHVDRGRSSGSEADMTKSFEVASRRAALLMNALNNEISRLAGPSNAVDHVFRSSAMGSFEGDTKLSTKIMDAIVFRVAIIER